MPSAPRPSLLQASNPLKPSPDWCLGSEKRRWVLVFLQAEQSWVSQAVGCVCDPHGPRQHMRAVSHRFFRGIASCSQTDKGQAWEMHQLLNWLKRLNYLFIYFFFFILILRYLDSGQPSQKFLPLASSSLQREGPHGWWSCPAQMGALGLWGHCFRGPGLGGALPPTTVWFPIDAGTALKKLLWRLWVKSSGTPWWKSQEKGQLLARGVSPCPNCVQDGCQIKSMSSCCSEHPSELSTTCIAIHGLAAAAQRAGSHILAPGRWRLQHPRLCSHSVAHPTFGENTN